MALLGAGGMGEVYRAVDTRLGREAAVKVLPGALAGDPDRRARFQREARAVAGLSHPNIVVLYDVGAEGDTAYAAMELLDGQTLAERLAEGPVPIRRATDWAVQIARGLAAAHERGIVHRDLKPANLFMTAEGVVKILDFGLARALEPSVALSGDSADSPTVLSPVASVPGVILGTAAYMSPEQARGQPVDARSDIFSFGAVLYEMVTGRRPFDRSTVPETMTAILREDPAPVRSDAGVSPALERVIARCLEKRPEDRFQTARDLAFAIENTSSVSATAAAAAQTDAVSVRPRGWRIVSLPIAAVAGLVLGALLVWTIRPAVPASEPVRIRHLTFTGTDSEPSASPDGRMIAFTSTRDGKSRIWLKQLAGGGEQVLTRGPDWRPRFSPDGSTVLFLRHEGASFAAYRIALVGGQERRVIGDVLEAVLAPAGPARLAFVRGSASDAEGSRVGILDEASGREEIVLTVRNWDLMGLSWSPDGQRLAVTRSTIQGAASGFRILVIDTVTRAVEEMDTTERAQATGLLSGASWLPGGRQLVMAASSDVVGDLAGFPSRVMRYDIEDGTHETLFWSPGLFPFRGSNLTFTRFSLLPAGALVFDTYSQQERLVQVGGGETNLPAPLTTGTGADRQPAYSPDGRQVIFSSNRAGNLDIWAIDLESGTLRQITDDPARDWDPAFTPDGRHVLYSSDRGGHLEVWMANADGSNARQVSSDGLDAENPTQTKDGRFIVYSSSNPERQGIWRVQPDGSGTMLLAGGGYTLPDISPDGRYALFVGIDNAALRNTIHVVDVNSGKRVDFLIELTFGPMSPNVSYGRGRWLPDGRAIAFVGLDAEGRTGIFAQDFVPGRDTTPTRRKLAGFDEHLMTESFGISPDGRQLTLAMVEEARHLMLAEGVPGLE